MRLARTFRAVVALPLLWAGVAAGAPQPDPSARLVLPARESFQYSIEWRLITAGRARVDWSRAEQSSEVKLHLESAGLVSKLYRVNNDYLAGLNAGQCAESVFLTTHEGRRHRETRVTFDRERRKAVYLERDIEKNSTVASHEIDIPACTHEIVGALDSLRTLRLAPGQSAQIPVSDGKKSVSVRVEAGQRETLRIAETPRPAVRYEAFLFNNVLYRRPGRVYVWLSDDARRTPLQIQVRLQFTIGTITLQLEKEE